MKMCACGSCVLLVTAFVMLLANRTVTPQFNRAQRVSFTSCSLPGVEGTAVCGTVDVPEDRDRPGRKIALNVAVVKATGAAPELDPIVPLQGGPGQGAVHMADFYARTLAPLRAHRDIVLIDVRGTGRSNPLTCDVAGPESLQSVDLLPPAAIAACRKTLEPRADLRLYTTHAIARDLDEVRRALGIERWNLYGTSYGTRLAQEYIRLFGSAVRTVTLKGIAPPSLTIPLPYARDAQTALELSIDEPTRRQLATVLAALRRQPVTVTHEGAQVSVSEGMFAEALRNLLYNPTAAGSASQMITSAASADFTPVVRTIVRLRRSFSGDIALGMFLSVTCAEDIPRIDASKIEDAVRGTFLRDYRLRQQMEACRHWVAGTRRSESATAVRSEVPALLFSGDLDPVTPPRFGEEVVRNFKNGRHIVLKGNGHAMGASAPCIVSMMKPFIERATVEGLNAGCATAGQ